MEGTWALVEALRETEIAGAVVPSFAPGAAADATNVVLWKWGSDLPHAISVIDDGGRLPRDAASWI